MPVRRDLTGYMYEFEVWQDSASLSGVLPGSSSPFFMTERTQRGGDWEKVRGTLAKDWKKQTAV